MLVIAVSSDENGIRVAAGARPKRAMVVTVGNLCSLTDPVRKRLKNMPEHGAVRLL